MPALCSGLSLRSSTEHSASPSLYLAQQAATDGPELTATSGPRLLAKLSNAYAPHAPGGTIYQNPTNDGNYTIHAEIHNPAANSIDWNTWQPPPAYGIQPIPQQPIHDMDVYGSYGPLRAYMTPNSPGGTQGAYFHGQFDGFGYTHGCLSYGEDTRMINYMYNHMSSPVGVSVDTQVQKP